MDKNYFESLCAICAVESPTHVFRPCNHKCICKSCALNYEDNNDKENFQKCPICRRKYDGIERFDGNQYYIEQEELLVEYATKMSLKEFQKAEKEKKEQESSSIRKEIQCTIKRLKRPPIPSVFYPLNPEPSTSGSSIQSSISTYTGTIPKLLKNTNRKNLEIAPYMQLDMLINEFIKKPIGNQINLSGRASVYFSPGMIVMFDNRLNQEIKFRLKNVDRIEITELNNQLLRRCYDETTNDNILFVINLNGIIDSLRKTAQENNENIMIMYGWLLAFKYKIKCLKNVNPNPLMISSTWKLYPMDTNLNISYVYNPSAMDHPVPLKDVRISMKIEKTFHFVESTAEWIPETCELVWSLPEIASDGILYARFKFADNKNLPKNVKIRANFFGTETTLSGMKFVPEDDKCLIKKVTMKFTSETFICSENVTRDEH